MVEKGTLTQFGEAIDQCGKDKETSRNLSLGHNVRVVLVRTM